MKVDDEMIMTKGDEMNMKRFASRMKARST